VSKKILCLLIAATVLTSAAVGVAQKTAARGKGGKKTPQVFLKTKAGYSRGWVQKERGKEVFIDAEGKSTPLGKNDQTIPMARMRKEFEQYQRSMSLQDLKDLEKYGKTLAWAKEHSYYEGVENCAERMIKLNPANPDPSAEESLKWARDQLAALKSGPAAEAVSSWTQEDIQKVRFALFPVEGPTTGLMATIKPEVIKQFFDAAKEQGKYATPESQKDFARKPNPEKVQIIKRMTGNQFQPGINLSKDPTAIIEFKRAVQPLLARCCAAAACHGGSEAQGQFKLDPRSTPQAMYANFYALDIQRSIKGSLVNHEKPDQSPLLSFMLPADQVTEKTAHPNEISPPIRSKKEARYQAILIWIKSLPKQPINELIEGATTTQPANQAETSASDATDTGKKE